MHSDDEREVRYIFFKFYTNDIVGLTSKIKYLMLKDIDCIIWANDTLSRQTYMYKYSINR